MNNVNLIGRLTADPETRYMPNGTVVSKFNVAIDRAISKEKKEAMESEGKSTADFPRVVVWGRQAELAEKYLKKGRLVGIEGSISTGSYDKEDGTRVYTTDVNARRIRYLERGSKVEAETAIDPNESEIPF